MVVRSGFGITVDPLPLARPLRGFYPFTVGSNFAGVNSFAPGGLLLATGNSRFRVEHIPVGIPPICCPDISSGTIPLPAQALERSVGPGELKRGYIESWNLIVERRLPGGFLASVGYVGTQTVHAFGDLDVNASLPGTGQAGQPYNTDTSRRNSPSARFRNSGQPVLCIGRDFSARTIIRCRPPLTDNSRMALW